MRRQYRLSGGQSMRMGLEDKAIIVTGAAQGIGAAIAQALAAEGVGALLLTDRNETARGPWPRG